MFVYQFEKYLAYVRFDVFVVWWIKPNNVHFLFLFLVLRGVNMSVGENLLLVSAVLYSPFALLKMVSLEELLYIHTSSNHPSPIIRQISESIARRLSDNSSYQIYG